MNDDPLWLAQVAFAALGDIAFASTLGAVLMNGWLSKEKAFAAISPARFGWTRARRIGSGGALVLAFANLVLLWLQAASMSGVPVMEAGASVWTVLTATHAGTGWAIAFAGSVLLVLATASGAPMGAGRLAFAAFAALVAAAGKASVGHAADAGAFSVAEVVQTLHLLATGVWGGVVIAGAFAVLPALGTSLARAFLIRIAGKMSTIAVVAVVLVIATGVFNALRGLGGAASVLQESVWGHVLIVKAVLVATALIFGGLNRWSALPRLQRTASTVDAHTVTNVMRVEGLLMIGVFVAASVLSHSVPGFAFGG
ncbi:MULTISPECIES: CopD family protein [unclassified Caballeronia]|uniref:CopD family protein n=1 Tax=unclassified Caballeronia TaxID=2646786 RepID=UPI00285E57C9|nr:MULTISPECIES: CopD family protein [unclassified Caballeronia]MDR5751586.1 CopD family protein [Caballeronia sp. LZ024]MDR5844274.1 CopD family protein [Caballeronia sp. LZ031]